MFDKGNGSSARSTVQRPVEPASVQGPGLAIALPGTEGGPDLIGPERGGIEVLRGGEPRDGAPAGLAGVTVVGGPAPVLSPYLCSWRKRAVDLVIGVPLALVAVPVVLVLALVALVSLRAWPFFVHHRVGRDGELFRMLKIRSLPRHAPRYASKYELGGVVTTRVGRYLRRTHLDELPQLFLVLWGSMSLVGPRPEMPQLMDCFGEDEAELRTRVRPGCTGLWQVSCDSGRLMHEVPHYDRSYLANARISLDIFLLWSTVRCALLSGRTVTFDDKFRARFGFGI